jgi:hypothetical protein
MLPGHAALLSVVGGIAILLNTHVPQAVGARFVLFHDAELGIPAGRLFVPDGFQVTDAGIDWPSDNPLCVATTRWTLTDGQGTYVACIPSCYGVVMKVPFQGPTYHGIPCYSSVPSHLDLVLDRLQWAGLPNVAVDRSDFSPVPSNAMIGEGNFHWEGGVGYFMYQGEIVELNIFSYWKGQVVLLVCPEDGLEDAKPLFAQIRWNSRLEPLFAATLDHISQRTIDRDEQIGLTALERARRYTAAMHQVSDEMYAAWRERNRREDLAFDRWRDAFLDVQKFHNPDGTTIKLPNGYDTYWRGTDGTYRYGGADFNPNLDRQPGVEYQQLHRAD